MRQSFDILSGIASEILSATGFGCDGARELASSLSSGRVEEAGMAKKLVIICGVCAGGSWICWFVGVLPMSC